MAINYGPTTKSYLEGLAFELKGLDTRAETFKDSKALIEAEISAAEKNLKLEEQEAARAAGSE